MPTLAEVRISIVTDKKYLPPLMLLYQTSVIEKCHQGRTITHKSELTINRAANQLGLHQCVCGITDEPHQSNQPISLLVGLISV